MTQTANWTQNSYRRFSVDIHIPDWNPALLSRFDPAAYVDCMARAGAQALIHYTKSHVGLCLWRTERGRCHAAMGERDFFGEVVAECRRRQIHPLAYFSLIHDNWAFETYPDWRIRRADGSEPAGRYGLVCPNSPYRAYALGCVEEIAARYDIVGMFFDMTFWPGLCYCPHCERRFLEEQGEVLPRIVDWDDPRWRAFQSARERWLLEFAQALTTTAKRTRSGLTVNHQYSTVLHNWQFGVPLELRDACDYVGGDFYGGPAQHSLACKLYASLSLGKPFEFHTSRTRIFTDHVTMKPKEEMRAEAFVATLHSAALWFVDYINVDGTLNPEVYAALGELSAQRAAYEPFLGGELQADVAIYFDKASLYNPDEQGVDALALKAADVCPHRDAVIGAARILQSAHVPFGVVTNLTLDQLARYRAVILPQVLEMTPAQAEIFRQFVAEGGVLYSSGLSSLDRVAAGGPRYLLEELFGVQYRGQVGTKMTYLTPEDDALVRALWPQDHLSYPGAMVETEPLPGAEVLARITLPFVAPETGRNLGSRFAAIYSDPPALQPERFPAAVRHRYGKGWGVWTAAPFETREEAVNAELVRQLLRSVLPGPFRFEAETHPAVEVTLFHQPERKRFLVGLLNMPRQLPPIPVGATLRVLLPAGASPRSVLRLPDCAPRSFEVCAPYVQFETDPFDTFEMLAVDYA